MSGHQNELERWVRWGDLYGDACSSFAEAEEAIANAESSSENYEDFYLDGFNLIWEARIALEPQECDPVKAKVLADKASQLAQTEGTKALGFDITGIYNSAFTGDHPIVARHYTLSDQHKPQMVIRQDGQKITGVDGSGSAILVGTRIKNVIKFKFSDPHTSNRELEGEWVVGYDGLNVLGTWRDPVSNASGEWNLTNIQQENRIDSLTNKEKHLQEFLSQRDAIKINYGVIDLITIEEKRHELVCGAPAVVF